MTLETIRLIETMAERAWPADQVEPLGGWLLRASQSRSRRPNSVWPNDDDGSLPPERKIELAEQFYRQRGQPARFQLCPAAQPDELDQQLERRGYTRDAPTAVQTAPLATVLSTTRHGSAHAVTVARALSDEWLEAYAAIHEMGPAEASANGLILERIDRPAGFALLRQASQPVATGLAVLERGWAGIFCMGTRLEQRRPGAARALLQALAGWARARGASQMYLQVMDDNLPARALYAQAGFETLYHYYYRQSA